MVSLFRSDRDKDKAAKSQTSKDQPVEIASTPERVRRSEDNAEASSSTNTPSRYRILRRKVSVKSPTNRGSPRPAAPAPSQAASEPVDRRDSPEHESSISLQSGPSEPPTASTFASFGAQQEDATAALAALGLTDGLTASPGYPTSPGGRRISEASKREGRVFGIPPKLPNLGPEDDGGDRDGEGVGSSGWRAGTGGRSLDMGSRPIDANLFDPEWTPKPPSSGLEPPLTYPTALSPPRRPMPRSPRPPPRGGSISSPSPRDRISNPDEAFLTDSPPGPSSPVLLEDPSAPRRNPLSPPASEGLRTSTAEWLSRPPNKIGGRKASLGSESPSRLRTGSPSSSPRSGRRADGHGRSTSATALSAITRRHLNLHDDSGTSSESAEEFGSDVGIRPSAMTRTAGFAGEELEGGAARYEVQVTCVDRRGDSDNTDDNEIKWEITVRKRHQLDRPPHGRHVPPPSSPLQLGPGSAGHIAQAPSAASSINLSLALDQPSGKLVFITIPMSMDPSTPRHSHSRSESRSSPRLRSTDRNTNSGIDGATRSPIASPVVPDVPRIPSRLSSAIASTTGASDSSRPCTPPPAPHPASTATLPVTPVSKRREGSHIYDRSYASPRTPSTTRTPGRVLHYMSPAAAAATLSPKPPILPSRSSSVTTPAGSISTIGTPGSAGHAAPTKQHRPSGSIANAARRSSLEGLSGGVGAATPLSPPTSAGQRRSRIVSADELAGGLFAAGTVDQFSEQLEDPIPLKAQDAQ